MPGSSLVNQRQHVGLQQLSALAGITHSSLGPATTYKFIQDEASGESSVVCSCFRLLENLEVTCAVGQLAWETIQAHQRTWHSGSQCLLFLAGAWSRAALECLHRGVSIPHIISTMSEGLEICLDVCRKNSVSIEDIGSAGSGRIRAATPQGLQLEQRKPSVVEPLQASSLLQRRATPQTQNFPSGQQKIKLSHSRHFCEAKAENVVSKHVDLVHVARAVSHGHVDTMDLVVEAGLMQSKNDTFSASHSTFDINKLVTCVLPNLSEEHACVLPGCVALLSAEQAYVTQRLKDKHLNVALIDGDMCEGYRHVGFNKPTGVGIVSETLATGSLSKEEDWIENVLATLLKLKVNLILLTGAVNEKLLQRCARHTVLVVEKMRPSILRAFADATGAIPVAYATQLTRHCVGAGLQVAVWRDLSGGDERRSSLAVNISSNNNGTGLVTAILTSCVRAKLQALEDRFWSCAYRLHWALRDGAVLPGAGAIEMLCVHGLQTHVCSTHRTTVQMESNPYRDVVLPLMADGLMDYVSTIMVNSGGCSKVEAWTSLSEQLKDFSGVSCVNAKFSKLLLSEGEMEDGPSPSDVKSGDDVSAARVFDNVSVKMEAWRKALDLVFIVLQTDAEVITGIDDKTVDAQANVSLL